ncbi:FAD-binding oxidoreductase [Bradyrhizobium sp. 83002]|uniref:FAD-binding oxidoreductase n=1 Tax=Bradyrhizobium aeschynomenes TaxID=2734909 RepID=UPI001552AE7E|nr:FAD-binding oxidoreductase [Bradyrhizobium aeschynomenes]NPU13477.1 FAD-binding oxidoreductase [Bradyrhizobium aeschynomenes]NPV19990.1 FAD-binding oxidoreductase [Bradyrhizobium aeschynomenes]
MISRRRFLRTAATAAALPLVRMPGARAELRTILNDASRLNPTPVAKHVVIKKPATDELIARLRAELKEAAAARRPMAAAVARHSMGGQSLPRDGTAVTLDGGAIELDTTARTYRTAAGNRWWDVIATLDAKGFSPAVMQSNSDFGVGSTFCVNAHGWPVPYGPFGSTVKSIRMLLADGTLVQCSRTENAELFGLAMGGYGLFGIIVDLEVEMVPNVLLEPRFERMTPDRFAERFMRSVDGDANVKMAYGRMSVSRKAFFDDALLVTFRPVPDAPTPLPAVTSSGKLTGVANTIYRAQTGWEVAKGLRWFMETQLGPAISDGRYTRNSLMAEPVANLAQKDMHRTDILHEYFVAPERFGEFLTACREIIPKARAEFLNVTLRYVAEDKTPVLSIAPVRRIAAVMSFSQSTSPEGEIDMMRTTEALIDRITAIGGAFYLPYRLHARRDQVEKAYPAVARFVAAKRQYDPNLLFRNAMWDAYFA